jgi:hypothetical protein
MAPAKTLQEPPGSQTPRSSPNPTVIVSSTTITRAGREKGRVDAAFQALRNDKNVIVIAR